MPLIYIEGSYGLERFHTKVQEAMANDGIQELALVSIPFCSDSTAQLMNLVQSRPWKSLLISNCTGNVAGFIESIAGRSSTAIVLHKLELRSLRALTPELGSALGQLLCRQVSIGLEEVTMSVLNIKNVFLSAMTREMTKGLLEEPSLRSLRWSCCTFADQVISDSMGDFLNLHAASLKTLKLDSCKLLDEHLAQLIGRLTKTQRQLGNDNAGLECISLPYNSPGKQTMTILSQLLEEPNTRLMFLDCGRQWHRPDEDDGRFTDLKEITAALCRNTSLETLNLSYSPLREEGIRWFATHYLAQPQRATLRRLYLDGTQLSIGSLRTLARALSFNTHLRQFWISGLQGLGSEGIRILCHDGLRLNHFLQDVVLFHSMDNSELAQEFEGYLDCNEGGRRLLLRDDVAPSLWPHVLERVHRVILTNRNSSPTPPEARRANVLYHFLRNKVLIETT